MTVFRCSKFVQHSGVKYDVGEPIELTNDEDIAHLEKQKAIESLEVPKKEVIDIVEQLCKVPGITKSLAKDLIEQGVKTIDQLGAMQEDELLNLKGVSKKLAEKIYNSFTDIKVK